MNCDVYLGLTSSPDIFIHEATMENKLKVDIMFKLGKPRNQVFHTKNFATKVNPPNWELCKQTKNIPVVLPSFPIKTWGKSIKGFMSYDQTYKQTYWYFFIYITVYFLGEMFRSWTLNSWHGRRYCSKSKSKSTCSFPS